MDTPRTAAAKRSIVAVNSIEHASLVISSLRASSMARRHSMSDIAVPVRPTTAPGEISDAPAVSSTQRFCEEDSLIYPSINLFDGVVASSAMKCILEKEKELSMMAALNGMSTMSIDQNDEEGSDRGIYTENVVKVDDSMSVHEITALDSASASTHSMHSSSMMAAINSSTPQMSNTCSHPNNNSTFGDGDDDDHSVDSFNMSSDEDDGPGLKGLNLLQTSGRNIDITAFDFGDGDDDDDGYHAKKRSVPMMSNSTTSIKGNEANSNKRGIPLVTSRKGTTGALPASRDKKVGGGSKPRTGSSTAHDADVDEGFVLDPVWLQQQELSDDETDTNTMVSDVKAKGAQGYVSVKDEKARKVARIKQQNEENRELFKGFVAPRASAVGGGSRDSTSLIAQSDESRRTKDTEVLSTKPYAAITSRASRVEGVGRSKGPMLNSVSSGKVIVKPGQRIRVMPGRAGQTNKRN